jgi:hypothetical protein
MGSRALAADAAAVAHFDGSLSRQIRHSLGWSHSPDWCFPEPSLFLLSKLTFLTAIGERFRFLIRQAR